MKFFLTLVLFLFLSGILLASEKEESLLEIKSVEDLIEKTVENPVKKKVVEKKEPKKVEKKKKPEPEEKTETKKKKEEPVHIEKKQAAKFTGKLSSFDVFLEKKAGIFYLWVRKKPGMASVALVTAEKYGAKNSRYFLRSDKEWSGDLKADYRVRYKDRLLGGGEELYFLASSVAKHHPMLGSAYPIVLPAKMIYGYKKGRTYGELALQPGKTKVLVRVFKESYASGKFADNRYCFPSVEKSVVVKPELRLIEQSERKGFELFEMVYRSPNRDLQEIWFKEEGGKAEKVFSFVDPKVEEAASSDRRFVLASWSYHYDREGLYVRFFVIRKKGKKLGLRIKHEQGEMKYDFRVVKPEELDELIDDE